MFDLSSSTQDQRNRLLDETVETTKGKHSNIAEYVLLKNDIQAQGENLSKLVIGGA